MRLMRWKDKIIFIPKQLNKININGHTFGLRVNNNIHSN